MSDYQNKDWRLLAGEMLPPTVENGVSDATLTLTTNGAVVFYTCNPGYMMVGGSTSVCLPDGTWSVAPRCVRGNTKVRFLLVDKCKI